ncbi:hypothetical protein ABIB25_004639 [Nakamurella sp. UYEF19]|uniref:hypothetical protein n=1 Tax=Nakamurella sp. UYEF19 TaxID=1756392 RepID=UPI003394E623
MARWQWPWRRIALPPALRAALDPDEEVQVLAELTGGDSLAVSRFGLWLTSGEVAVRWNWERVSKARLTDRTLTVIAAEEVGATAAGIAVLRDLPPRQFELAASSSLTDAVHARVRRSVAASRYLMWPGAAGWVVLRRVPGRDGLTRQIRLDPGADPDADGFLPLVVRTAAELEADLLGVDL